MAHRESCDTPFDLCEPFDRTESTSERYIMPFSFDRRDTVLLAKDNNANICRREMHGASEAIRFSVKKS